MTEGTFGEPGFKRAEHVIFEGADDLPDGHYGTSQRYKWAKNKDKGMLLAWAMNGQVSTLSKLAFTAMSLLLSSVHALVVALMLTMTTAAGTRPWLSAKISRPRPNWRT